MKIIYADGKTEKEYLSKLRERSNNTDKNVTATVSDIIENVRTRGDAAVREYTIKFDGKAPEFFEVPKDELNAAVSLCKPEFIETAEKAAEIYLKIAHLPRLNTIKDSELRQLAEHFNVEPRKGYLDD